MNPKFPPTRDLSELTRVPHVAGTPDVPATTHQSRAFVRSPSRRKPSVSPSCCSARAGYILPAFRLLAFASACVTRPHLFALHTRKARSRTTWTGRRTRGSLRAPSAASVRPGRGGIARAPRGGKGGGRLGLRGGGVKVPDQTKERDFFRNGLGGTSVRWRSSGRRMRRRMKDS